MKRVIITEKQAKRLLVQEYFDRETQALWDYFTMSREEENNALIKEYFTRFDTFIQWELSDEEYNELQTNGDIDEIVIMCDNRDEYLINAIINGEYSQYRERFASYLRTELEDTPQYSPAWLTLTNPQQIPNQWLIHFSDESFWISSEGFKHAKPNINSLAYTKWLDDATYTELEEEGYCFAYDVDDFANYYKTFGDRLKYGNEAVIFRASGIKLWHCGDLEYQVIFWGPNAKDFIYIENTDDGWCVKSTKSGRVLYKGETVPQVVEWATNNYDQYKNHIVDYKGKKNYDSDRYYKQNQPKQ